MTKLYDFLDTRLILYFCVVLIYLFFFFCNFIGQSTYYNFFGFLYFCERELMAHGVAVI